jgi:hypothetical protein
VLFDHPIHGSTLALRLDESFGTDAVLRASQSAIRNLRAIGDLDEEWFAPDSDCAKDGSGCVGQQPEIGEKGSVGRRNVSAGNRRGCCKNQFCTSGLESGNNTPEVLLILFDWGYLPTLVWRYVRPFVVQVFQVREGQN